MPDKIGIIIALITVSSFKNILTLFLIQEGNFYWIKEEGAWKLAWTEF